MRPPAFPRPAEVIDDDRQIGIPGGDWRYRLQRLRREECGRNPLTLGDGEELVHRFRRRPALTLIRMKRQPHSQHARLIEPALDEIEGAGSDWIDPAHDAEAIRPARGAAEG